MSEKLDERIIESYTGVTKERKKSRLPARLDFLQSASGAFLAIFMIAHMFFVSSILLGKEAMYKVARFFELDFIIDGGAPWLVSVIALIVFIALVTHAFLALRKFPINYKQFLALRVHKDIMKHGDTSYWWIQAATGFALFFMAAVHLFIMFTKPESIGPSSSAYRFAQENFWILYIFLLFAVELHGSIGLYRLCIKWGWFEGLGISALRAIKVAMSAFFIILGLVTFYAYMSLGSELDKEKGIEAYIQQDISEFGSK